MGKVLRRKNGITLVALVITVIILLILAGISIGQLTGSGLFERAKEATEEYEMKAAREKLETELINLHIDKNIESDYNNKEYIDNKLAQKEMAVIGNIVIVDGWRFEIDRTVPKIGQVLGKGEENSNIEIATSKAISDDYVSATVEIKITTDEKIKKITINGVEESIPTAENGVYTISKITKENGVYNIVVTDKNEGYKTGKVEVTEITEDMEIWNKADMENFRDKVNSGRTFEGRTATVMADIDLNEDKYTVEEDGTVTFTSDAEQWVPIANCGADNTLKFKGTFEGNNYTINNLYINTTENSQGLFGRVEGTIKNVKIANSYISASYCVGAFVGTMNGTIENCHTENTVKIVGNSQNIIAGTYLGGVVGQCTSTNITKCSNSATVSGESNFVGGIVGVAASTEIVECYNIGNVVGNTQNIGGILGINHTDTTNIIDCYNLGNINGNILVGGIAGSSHDTVGTLNIKNAYNKGSVTGSRKVGQIIGAWTRTGTETNTYSSTQTVTAKLLGDAFTDDIQNLDGTWKYNKGFPILKWQLEK